METYQIIALLALIAVVFASMYKDIVKYMNKPAVVETTVDKEQQSIVDKRVEQLYEIYQQRLSSGDDASAVIAGRVYYTMKRIGYLSLIDEMAIQNDIAESKK